MNTFIYTNPSTQKTVERYAKVLLKGAETITERVSDAEDWRERDLSTVLVSAKEGDTIAVWDGPSLDSSHRQVLRFLIAALEKGVHIQFMKYGLTFKAEQVNPLGHLLNLSHKIEKDFISRRNKAMMQNRKALGIRLGRPQGRKNAIFKLDKFKQDIARYLELSLSKASIAKLVDCHPQTLDNWIVRNELNEGREAKRVSRTRTKKAELA